MDSITNGTTPLTNKEITNLNDPEKSTLTETSEKKEQYIAHRAFAYFVSSLALTVFGGNTVVTAISMTGTPMLATLVPGALLFVLGICSINGIIAAIKEKTNTHDDFHDIWRKNVQTDFFNCVESFNKKLSESVTLLAVGILIAAVSGQSERETIYCNIFS